MPNWSSLRVPLADIRRTLGDDHGLKEVLVKELYRQSVYTKVPFLHLYHLLDQVVKEVRNQTNRFVEDEYPPQSVNMLIVSFEMPTTGKVGASTWEQTVQV